jgi:hypothetical protein
MRLCNPPAHNAQQGIIAHRHHQPFGKGRSWPAAQRQPKMMHNRLKSTSSAAVTSQDRIAKPFTEDTAATQNSVAPEAPSMDDQFDVAAAYWQICRPAGIDTLDPAALSAAVRACCMWHPGTQLDFDPSAVDTYCIDCETIWRQACTSKAIRHRLIPHKSAESPHKHQQL